MDRMNFYGTPTVPAQEQRSVEFCIEGLLDAGLPKDRLQILRYTLTENRKYSRYCAWTDDEVESTLAFIDEHLPINDRLPGWGQELGKKAKAKVKTFSEILPAVPTELEAFASTLPYRPYVSNNLEFGLKIVGRGTADLFRYIQPNPPAIMNWMVFDCDYAGALALAERKRLPLPNLVAVNPSNGNSHLLYQLRDPVCTSDMASMKPLRMLHRVQHAMTTALEADQAYGGYICKNPLHEHWLVQKVHDKVWGLLDFKEHLEIPLKLPKKAYLQGVGRNCTVFETVRREAYKRVLSYRLAAAGLDAFHAEVHALAVQENSRFQEPLPSAEIRSIAKSIATWVWRKYTGRLTDEAFSKRQASRGKYGGLAKGQANAEKRVEARLLASTGMKQQAIADRLEVSQMTVSRWLR